ncbi:propionyl- carboxylase [Moniliophthora roreri MCA 2997]|uniref:Propionyl-carboxylase n=1 Tax=Moniliophthora roreri (strain MCA 2997) TaxID=1381753 RepID=V2WMF9_MONRO|nr:propionyl- carboxylase [Moniliophthora roreri MCA 2997]
MIFESTEFDYLQERVAELRGQQGIIRRPPVDDPGYIRQKQAGKLWVRERIDALLDKNSFFEIGSITGKPVYDEKTGELISFVPANIITGWGKIDGRKIFVTADDFSVRGGHADGGIAGKAPHGETLARKGRVPLVRLLDGSSGGGSVTTYLTTGSTYIPTLAGLGQSLDAMAVVPVASALLGPVVGLAAAKAVTSHFSIMVKGLSQFFAAGPPVVKEATFENLTKEELGGWEIHARNGSIDNVVTTELEAFQAIRTFLSYLPSSIFVLPPAVPYTDPRDRREQELLDIIPRKRGRPYDIRRLIALIVDAGSWFEIGETWGRNVVCGFARLEGRSLGVISSDCKVNGGAIDAFGAQKIARFIHLCDHFHVPVLNLLDQPGFAIGSLAERMATIRHGATAMVAIYNATVPIFTIVIRRAFGVAASVFADPEDGKNYRMAWPSADWGSLPIEGGVEAAYKRQLENAAQESPEAREKLMMDLMGQFEPVRNPLRNANKFGVEEIIDPRDTRPLACDWLIHAYEHVLPQLVTLTAANYGHDSKLSSGRGYKL